MTDITICGYRIIEEIGRGAMGRVYKCQDTRLDRLAAVKVVVEKFLDNPEVLKRFEREGRAAAALNHPNICTLYEVGGWNGRPFLAMELLQGETVKHRIKRHQLFARRELVALATQIAGALEAAHGAGILHRDVKPSNIFLAMSGNAKLLDFGLAKIVADKPAPPPTDTMATMAMSFATIPGAILGTFAYMSPEQARGMPLDTRSDLYSLGVVLHEMATGELPLGGVAGSALPVWLRPIVQKLLAVSPADRYQSASELGAELTAIALNEHTAALRL